KWDKRAKSSTKELYLSRQIEIQPCFNNDFLAELTDAATTNLAELDALLDGTLPLSGSGIIDYQSTMSSSVHDPRTFSTTIIAVEDPATDLESDLVTLFHDNRIPEIHEFIEKRRQAMMQDEDDLLSRVFFRICTEASVELLVILLSTKAVDVNLSDDINSRTCLHEAAILGKLDLIKLLTEHGASIQATDMYGRTPLHYAAMYGRYECAVFLITSGSPVDLADLDDCSPLVHAVIGGHTKCVEALLDRGTSIERSSASGPDPLSLACEYGHKDIATLLLKKGARLAANITDGGLSALHVTAREGHAELCSLLIESGADVDLRDGFAGWTPIFYSASEGHVDCVKVLLAAGCSVDVRDETDWLPWTYALYRGHIEVAKLVEVEVDVEPTTAAKEEVRGILDLPLPMEVGIQPMAPSALFVEDVEMDGLNIDSIPSLSLPPPIIPFRIYGHNYLEKKSYLQLNFNGISSTGASNPIKLFGSRQLSSLKLIISSKPDLGIPYSVILPLKDDTEVYTFLIDDDNASMENFALQFDIYPTFGTKVLGRAVVLASQLLLALNKHSSGAADNEVCVAPLFDNHLRVVGELSFEFSLVRAFNHEKLQIGGKVETYWKSTQVVNNAKSTSESGVRSFVTASSLVEEYINVEVQLSRDLKTIVYSEWFIHSLDSRSSNPALATSSSASPSFEVSPFDLPFAGAVNILSSLNGRTPLYHPSDAFKGLEAGTAEFARVINENLFTLEDILKILPPTIGLCIDIKYPTSHERETLHLKNYPDVNTYVDLVLKTIYDHGSDRSFIFSSFNPSICTALSWKQPNYGVFFKTRCGYDVGAGRGETDKRCTSIKEAVRFAKKSNFLGIVCEATPLIKVPVLINTIKESGLILATFGEANDVAKNVQIQEAGGVDAILAGGVLKYNSS
ncbi:phosphate system positive regulatory protein pho81, partial [Dinochytrium kinnereticum]